MTNFGSFEDSGLFSISFSASEIFKSAEGEIPRLLTPAVNSFVETETIFDKFMKIRNQNLISVQRLSPEGPSNFLLQFKNFTLTNFPSLFRLYLAHVIECSQLILFLEVSLSQRRGGLRPLTICQRARCLHLSVFVREGARCLYLSVFVSEGPRSMLIKHWPALGAPRPHFLSQTLSPLFPRPSSRIQQSARSPR